MLRDVPNLDRYKDAWSLIPRHLRSAARARSRRVH
jgi:hypothetical protein